MLDWFMLAKLDHAPTWVRKLQRKALQRDFVAYMVKAQRSGISMSETWFPPHTASGVVLNWIEDHLATAPRITESDVFRIVVGPCPEQHWTNPQIAPDAEGTMWQGTRAGWWEEGRGIMAAVLHGTHPGVYAGVNATSRLIKKR